MEPLHQPTFVNDVHSGLHPTRIARLVTPGSAAQVSAAIRQAAAAGLPVAVCGARHAMGGQQFATDAVLLDLRAMDRVLAFDPARGLVEVEAGITWPALIDHLERAPDDGGARWSIRQKQTGADGLSIGGCLSANVHGRGLQMQPFIADVESFTLIDAHGAPRLCSRHVNRELFALAIGGYGLFGVIVSVTLRLAPRRKLRRDVAILSLDQLMPAFAQRIADGYTFGDFQFAIDPASPDFMVRGVFSCYVPVDDRTAVTAAPRELMEDDWRELLRLAHTDKTAAFDCYARHYLATDGQVCWSDRLQQSTYIDHYHLELDRVLGHCGSEIIGELYVPRAALAGFMRAAAQDFRTHGVDLIYGTIRLIERDRESFLPWARQDYACVIFNLHTPHTAEGIEASHAAFRRLIDLALAADGSFYLTYARAATIAQVRAAYPRFDDFLAMKRRFDPQLRFQSDWYRHYQGLAAAD